MSLIQKGLIQRISSSGGGSAFDAITSGTNTTATMVVGTGASLATSGSGTIAATSTVVANEASDTTCFPVFVTAATGALASKSNTALTYNSSTGALGSTSFVGALTGNASTATALQNARTIGGTSFDGTANITVATATGGFAVSGGNMTVAGTDTVTSASATAFSVGRQGATNPVLNIDASTSSQVGGINIVGAATGGTTSITATDSGSNQGISINGKGSGNVLLNAISGSVKLQINSADKINIASSSQSYGAGNRTAVTTAFYTWTCASGASLTASTEAPLFTFNLDTAAQQHATGSLTLQRDYLIKNSTHSFVGSSTLTDAATLGIVGAPIASTNATITNSSTIYSAGANVGAGCTNSYGLNITANTGATNNYAALLTGHVLVASGGLRPATYTVATLPASPPTGSIAVVTDQLTTVNAKGAAPTGGGSVVCAQIYNGSAWVGI